MSIWRWKFRRAREDELNEEIQGHLRMAEQERKIHGETAEQARAAAHREFGNLALVKEVTRAMWGFVWLETWLQDLRYGLRQLRRNPGFTAVAVITLALGIGVNTAIFSIINAVMLRMLPVENPDRLVQIAFRGKHSGQSFVGESFPYTLFKELRQSNQVFTGITAFDYWDSFDAHVANLGSATEPIQVQLASANFFSLLGVNAAVGRTFTPDEEGVAGAHPVAVISDGLWTRLFARDRSVLGKKLLIDGAPFTIVGVLPPHFSGVSPGQACDLWVPVSMQPQVIPGGNRLTESDTNWLSLLARLKTGVTVEQARAGLDLLYQQLLRQHDTSQWSEQDRQDFITRHIVLLPAAQGTDYLRQEFSRPLFLLMAMVGVVLLVACANVANLLLARARAREREIAVRLALGAGRGRLIRQLLTESALLALAGAAFGVLLAYWGSPLFVALMGHGEYLVTLDVHPDPSVLAFTLLIALGTGIVFGLAPAHRATRAGGGDGMKAGPRSRTASRKGRHLGQALVIAQVALSLVMTIGAGLLVRTLRNLETLNPGFSRQNVLMFIFDPTKAGYKGEQAVEVRREALERIQQMPGVRSVTYSFLTPISGGGWDNVARDVEGYTPQPNEDMDVYLNAVGPRFFETLGTPVLLGRDFGPQDTSGSPPGALINQTMAHRFFANRNPIGKHFRLGSWSDRRDYEVLGVVADAKYLSLREEVPPTAYLYIPQLPPEAAGGVTIEVKSAVPPMSLVPGLRGVLRSLDSRLSSAGIKTLAEQVDQSLYQEKLVSTLSSFFAVLALLLASIGLYGVLSYVVACRTSEIGIRMALGAGSRRVLRMVLGEALTLVALGIILGVPAAMAASRLVARMLYGLRGTDSKTILAAVAVMIFVAVTAGWLPARRATKVEPMAALRCE